MLNGYLPCACRGQVDVVLNIMLIILMTQVDTE